MQGVLFYGYSNNLPDFIYLNDDDQENYRNGLDTNSKKINIPDNLGHINTVRLIWNSKLSGHIELFGKMDNLLEVDFSKFDSSEVDNIN